VNNYLSEINSCTNLLSDEHNIAAAAIGGSSI
jgi:hypothetical protein